MPIDLNVLSRRTDPQKTILFFGAGSSIPSGGPSSATLVATLASKFKIQLTTPLDLFDLATIVETKYDRRALITALGDILNPLKPVRGIVNLPDFDWAGLYTTNYDCLIEKSFALRNRPLHVVSSNFDFGAPIDATEQQLYKLHGTIECDISLGHQHRIVISRWDYDLTSEYREALYGKFTEQLLTNDAIVIGHSLGDPDLRNILDNAIRVKRDKGTPGRITVFAYTPDENLALVHEARGMDVCFGGIDEFFREMNPPVESGEPLYGLTDNPLDRARKVHPSTIPVSSMQPSQPGNLSRMFNGRPATYGDINNGWTFDRVFADRLEAQFAEVVGKRVAYVLGTAGSGKTTGARKALTQLAARGIDCWEHVADFALPVHSWQLVDDELRRRDRTGVLFIDDAHRHLHDVNVLVDAICKDDKPGLKLLLVSSRPNWNPRLKSPAIFKHGEPYKLGTLSEREIESLLDILDTNNAVAALVEARFLGFNRAERQRRLAERCRSDMFVCMKNIFASESLDDIILREYAELFQDYQEVYKRVAGMEAAGVRVHRQLVIRTVGIEAFQITRYLDDLDGIIEEQTVSRKHGIFAWQVRHGVIAEIIAKYKFVDEDERFTLLEHTIDNLNPSYRMEIESMNEICDPQRGLAWIYDKRKQNVLLRKMISLAPRQRVPRHRLITNLISLGEYEGATTEIRLFENELQLDAPVQRYKVRLLIERARRTTGILREDRAAIIRNAAALAEAGIKRFPDDKNLYKTYLEVGVASAKTEASREIFDEAMEMAKSAYDRILDPDLARTIRKYEGVERLLDTRATGNVAG